MQHQIEATRHSSLLNYLDQNVDDSFDYDKREDASFTGVLGRIMLEQTLSESALSNMKSGSETFIELTKYGILHDLVLKLKLTVTDVLTDAAADQAGKELKIASGVSVFDFIEKLEVRTRSGYLLYEVTPWTYMQTLVGCKFERYRKLAVSNFEKRKFDSGTGAISYKQFSATYGIRDGDTNTATASFDLNIPIYLEWFRKLAKCPDMLSLEDCHLVLKMKSKSQLTELFTYPIVAAGLAHDLTVSYNTGSSIRQYYVQPPQDRYNAILQSKHEGGLPFNMLTVNHFPERIMDLPLAAGAQIGLKQKVELKCQFPVYRTFIRVVYVPNGDALKTAGGLVNFRQLLPITGVTVQEAGQTFYETSRSAGPLETEDLFDNILAYDNADSTQSEQNDEDFDHVMTINWSMQGLLPDGDSSRTAVSFFQMTNPTIAVQYIKTNDAQQGTVYVETVHEHITVFATQASANMRNRSIRRLATK